MAVLATFPLGVALKKLKSPAVREKIVPTIDTKNRTLITLSKIYTPNKKLYYKK
jgi:hypothetical protein